MTVDTNENKSSRVPTKKSIFAMAISSVSILTICVFFSLLSYKEYILKSYIKDINSANSKVNEMVATRVSDDVKFKQALLDSVSYMNPRIDPSINEQIVEVTINESKKYNFPPLLLLCVMNEESNFNPLARNNLGTVGLMQVIPEFHKKKIDKYKLKVHEVYFIKNNIILGTEILEDYFNETGNMSSALQKYVGATVKENAKQYIDNITNNYITLNVMLFMNKKKVEQAATPKVSSNNPFNGSATK